MRILMTGATGFIGLAVARRLRSDGHEVTALVRDRARARAALGDAVALVDGAGADPARALDVALEGVEGVINLAGEPILGGRWTEARRRRLVDSRVALTRGLVAAMGVAARPPRVLVSASAIGYYGDRGDETLDEDSAAGTGFLAGLTGAWELEAQAAARAGVRVANPRIGIVLGRDGGALARMLPLFRLGLGGPLGSGRQFQSWIHLDDAVAGIAHALGDERLSGPFNLVAPGPVTSREFARALGRRLRRPALLPAPSPALRLAFGEAASVLLESQRVEPRRLAALGFAFRFPSLDRALEDLLAPGRGPSR